MSYPPLSDRFMLKKHASKLWRVIICDYQPKKSEGKSPSGAAVCGLRSDPAKIRRQGWIAGEAAGK